MNKFIKFLNKYKFSYMFIITIIFLSLSIYFTINKNLEMSLILYTLTGLCAWMTSLSKLNK